MWLQKINKSMTCDICNKTFTHQLPFKTHKCSNELNAASENGKKQLVVPNKQKVYNPHNGYKPSLKERDKNDDENNSKNDIALRDIYQCNKKLTPNGGVIPVLYFDTVNEKPDTFVSSNDTIKKLVNRKNEVAIDKNKVKQSTGKGQKDTQANLNNKKLAEVEGLLKRDFSEKFTYLKKEKNDFIIKDQCEEQLKKCSMFIKDMVIAKIMCDNDSVNLSTEIKFTSEEAQKRANLSFMMKIKYDFMMEKVLSFVNSMMEINDVEKENDSSKNLMLESEIKSEHLDETLIETTRNQKNMLNSIPRTFPEGLDETIIGHSKKVATDLKRKRILKKLKRIAKYQVNQDKSNDIKPNLNDYDKMLILTKSDEDRVQFRTIVETMLTQTSLDEGFKCLVCNKEFKSNHAKHNAISHVDHTHTDHILHKCHICDKIVKTSDSLTRHIGKYHKSMKRDKFERKQKKMLKSISGLPQDTKLASRPNEYDKISKMRAPLNNSIKTEHIINENDNTTNVRVPVIVLANNFKDPNDTRLPEHDNNSIKTEPIITDMNMIKKTNNIDSWQRPLSFKFNIPSLNKEIPKLSKPMIEPSVIETDAIKTVLDNIKNESNIESDISDNFDSKFANSQIHDDPNNDKKLILTRSDEDKAQFKIIVESMIRKKKKKEGYKCLKCDKEFNGPHARPHAICHVDIKHAHHLLHKCHICDLIVKTKDSLCRHIGKNHKSNKESQK